MKTAGLACRAARTAPVLLLCGCFSYRPAQLETVPVGEDIRVHITRQALLDLPDVQEGISPIVNGKLVRRDNERLFINVPVGRRQDGFFVSAIGQEVGIRTGEIVQLEVRKLNRTTTGFFIAGTAAAVATVVYLIIEAAGRNPVPTPPPPDEFRIPVFSFPVR